jgi:hypothetical protein
MAYQLLDTLLWAQGWEKHPKWSYQPQKPRPNLAEPLNSLVSSLSRWSIDPLQFLSAPTGMPLITNNEASSTAQLVRTTIVSIDEMGQKRLDAAMKNFKLAEGHLNQRDKHHILAQWHSVAFVVGAFRPVRVCIHPRISIYNYYVCSHI